MKSVLQVLVVVATIVIGLNATKIKQCKGDDPPPINTVMLQLGNCKNEEPCVLKRGGKYKLNVLFKAPANADKVETAAIGEIFGRPILISSGSDPDACKNIKGQSGKKGCPLKKGKKYKYTRDIEISDNEFKIEMKIDWLLKKKESNTSIVCAQTYVEIADKDS